MWSDEANVSLRAVKTARATQAAGEAASLLHLLALRLFSEVFPTSRCFITLLRCLFAASSLRSRQHCRHLTSQTEGSPMTATQTERLMDVAMCERSRDHNAVGDGRSSDAAAAAAGETWRNSTRDEGISGVMSLFWCATV